jgi:hypothetical protein
MRLRSSCAVSNCRSGGDTLGTRAIRANLCPNRSEQPKLWRPDFCAAEISPLTYGYDHLTVVLMSWIEPKVAGCDVPIDDNVPVGG